MKQFDVGIVGAGVIASNMHIPVLRAMPGVRIAWIADSSAALAAKIAGLHKTQAISPAAVLEGEHPDAILLAIPLPARASYFEALKGGETAIFAEKPLANSVSEHEALGTAFADWQVAVGYQRRYYAQFRLAKRIVETGVFGPLRRIAISEGGRTTRTGGGGDYQALPIALGGGIVKNLGCHALDLAQWLAGSERFEIADCQLEIDGGSDVACRANGRLDGGNGSSCELDFAVSWLDRMDNRVTLTFDTASIVCPVSPSPALDVHSLRGDRIGTLDASGDGATTSAQAFFLEWRDFLASASNRTPQPLSPRATRPVAMIMDRILAPGGRT